MATKISIYRDGVWAGDGTIDEDGIECSAVLGATQDASEETYAAIDWAYSCGDRSGSVVRPDGEYTWELDR